MRTRTDIELSIIKNRQDIETIEIAEFQGEKTDWKKLKQLLIEKDDLIIELAERIKKDRETK
jgi:hypothetical protein